MPHHIGVIPIGGLHALLSQWCPQLVETALKHFVTGDGAALDVIDVTQQLAQTFQHGHGFGGKTAVVSPLHDAVVRVGAHDNELRVES